MNPTKFARKVLPQSSRWCVRHADMACVVELAVLSLHDADGSEKQLGVKFLGRNVATNVAQECALAFSPTCCVHELAAAAHKHEFKLHVVVTGRHGSTMLLRLSGTEQTTRCSSELGKRTRPYYPEEA